MDLQRQSFLGQQSEFVLKHARVAIIGLCGGGSHVAQQLAHIGFRRLVLVDHDRADGTNINRMVGLTADDVHEKCLKTQVIAKRILEINPEALPEVQPHLWQECEAVLRDCDAIVGCVDSYAQRDQLERFCRRFLIPYVDVGMDVHGDQGQFFISGQSILSLPGHACMRCMGFLNEDVLSREAAAYGAAGGKPQVVWPNGTLASIAVGQLMALLTPWNPQLQPPLYVDYDGNRSMVTPNRRLEFIDTARCPHFEGPTALGDVDWS